MAHSQELENWDDDFDFGSPRNSPVPTAAPIHHAVHRTRSQAYQQRSHANLHSQSSLEHGLSLTHRQTASRTNLGSSSSRGLNHPPSTTYLRPKENRQARYSGNSEDWDMDMADTTAKAPPLPPPPAMLLASTSAAPKPPPLSVVPTAPSPQQLVDHDSQIIHLNARRSPEPSENVSPTMSAFSIPLSANSSVRNPAHSIGGSSTNFLLHSGRRSLLEMEKGRQDRERRRLRKKSRPSGVGAGGAPMMDDDDDLDAHEAYLRAGGGGGSSGVPRRYMPPPRAAGAGGDNSSSELDESGDDRGNLSELEEELASPSKVARVDPSSARIPRQQPPSTNTNLKPSSSRPTLSGVISTSRGLISSVVTSTPPSSSKTLPAHSPSTSGAAAVAPPSKLSRKTSNSNVIQKSSHHSNSTPFLSSGGGGSGSGAIKSKSSVQPSAPTSPQAQIHAKSIEPATSTSMSATTSMSPLRRSIDINSIHTTNQHQQQQQYEEGVHLNDCGSSIAASSHKARQPLLSRLSSLKRWGKAHSPSSLLSSSAKLPSMSMSGVAFPTNLSSTDFRSGSPSPSPPHVSPMTSPQKPPAVPSSSSAAATPSRSKFGLLRRPSLQFRNNESATAANESTSTSATGAAPGGVESATNPQVSTIKDEGRRGLNPFRRVSITGMKRLVGDPHHSSTDSSTTPSTNPPTKTPDSKRSSYKPESATQTLAPENKSSGSSSARQRTLSFMNRMRSKSGGNESPQAKPTINSVVVSAAGSAAGVGAGASNGESSSATRAPHTVGRSAAMAKAPKPPVRTAMGMMMIGTSDKNKNKNKDKDNNGSSSTSNSSSPVPSSPASTNSPRQLPLPLPLPSPRSQSRAMSPLPTFETNANANSKGSVRSSTLMTTPKGDRRAMHPHTHTHTHTPLSSDQDVTPRPSRHRQPEPTSSSRDRDRDRTTPSHHHHHERERTAKGTMPMPMPMPMSSSSSISRATSGSGSGSGSVHADSTPRALKTSKALPPTTTMTTVDLLSSGAMTMGRVSGSNAMLVERKEKEGGVRRSSVGANADSSTTTATTTTPSRRRGDLKIPTMISMKQGALKRELEAVKEFATGVEDLKRLQSSYQSMVSHVSKGRNTSSRTAARQLSVVENIGSQYSIWWECADLLIELGGAAPPTVAGTPMYENENPHLGGNSNVYAGRTDTISMSSAHSYGTQRSHTSTSSNGDLSNRQLQLLRQMLMTPNPRSFHDPALLSHPMKPSGSQATLSSEYSSTQSAEMSGTPSRLGHRRGELSGSGSDHMMSDMGSRRGTKSSIDSGDSTHRSTREFVLPTNSKSPYTPGTWRDKAGKSSSSNRPSLAGMFAKPTDAAASSGSNARSSKGAATASRGTLDGSNSSSATGRGTTDDDDDISDWDAESETGDKPSSLLSGGGGGGGGSRYLTTPSTTSSSFDALPTKLALTPENIAPLLEYAREVKVRLYDCLDRLSRELKAASSSSSSSGAAPPSAHMSSRDRSTTTTTAGTSSMKRA